MTSKSEMAGKLMWYCRGRDIRGPLGCHDERPLEFLPDGTIGLGAAGREAFWRLQGDELHILGRNGQLTAALKRKDNQRWLWTGQWAVCEKMPIKLCIHRAQVLIDLIQERGYERGAEIGIFEGETSELVLRFCPQFKLVMIDPENMQKALERTKSYRTRRLPIISDEATVATFMAPGSFDIVFLDADHSYEAVYGGIKRWLPLVRKGGLLTGHDYGQTDWNFGVDKAVQQIESELGVKAAILPDYMFSFEVAEDSS